MSDLALQLIAENKRSKETFLDLGNCALTEVPAEVGELVWLESLSFASYRSEWDGREWQRRNSRNTGDSNRYLIDFRSLAGLSALQTLYLPQASVPDLTSLVGLSNLQTLAFSGTRVTHLRSLAGLSALRSLFLSNTEVSDLEPLAGLSVLQTLDVSSTKVTDLAPLASLSDLQSLMAHNTQISNLTPLAGLSALQTLDISHTQVTDLAPLAGLSVLQTLDVSSTKVTDLAPLASLSDLQSLVAHNTQISNLTPLAGLSALQTLDVWGTQVTDLAPLAGLSALQDLCVRGTKVSDLAPLVGLSALQRLEVDDTQVTDLAPLASLSALRSLDVRVTQVSDLAPLAGLSALQMLSVFGTKVSDLSPLIQHIRRGFPVKWEQIGGDGIYVERCPLTNPPPEIVKQGNDAILNYFRERAGGVDHLYEAKMLILGEGGSGKTSLLRRLYQPGEPLPTEKETTRGIAIHRHEFKLKNGRTFRLNVWDFGGQEIYHATHQFFLTHRSLYVLVDDTRKDYKSVSDEGFKYWLELIDVFGGHSPTVIFQNEKDGRSKPIDIAGIKSRYDNVKELYAGNLEKADAADDVRDGIQHFASHLSHIGEELPARWIKVRADIEQLAAKQPYVPVEKYFEIYGGHIEFDETKALLLGRYLHDLGVFLHFQDDLLLKNTVILQNEWATEAVFRVLDDESIKKKLGRFSHEDCARLWKDSVYARMHPELLALMQKFELCYELRDSKPPVWLVPQLLPPAKPTALADWGKPEDLVLRYRYDFLPKGMISRLTVRLHRFVRDPEMAWVTGMLFERDRSAVLVEVLANGSEIELRARGPEHKALLSVIAADLDALNESFQGLRDKVDKRIPCNCKVCRVVQVPEFFDQKELLYRKEHNKLKVECRRSFEDVGVLELLDGIKLDKLPGWANEAPSASTLRTIRIFLASSSELREDRDAFDLYFRQQNDQLRKKGFYLEIVRWENFLDAMSETRSQDEYNKAICECDIFVSLFFTKTGKFTDEEFDVAHRQFKKTRKPLIYTFFKNADVKTGSARKEDFESLWAFHAKLDKLGHFRTGYDNIEHLKRQFGDQLDKLLERYDSWTGASEAASR